MQEYLTFRLTPLADIHDFSEQFSYSCTQWRQIRSNIPWSGYQNWITLYSGYQNWITLYSVYQNWITLYSGYQTGICFSLSATTLDYLYVQCNNKDSFWQCTKTGLFTGVNTVTELCLVLLYTQCGISIRGKWEQKAQLSARQLHPPTHHCYINI